MASLDRDPADAVLKDRTCFAHDALVPGDLLDRRAQADVIEPRPCVLQRQPLALGELDRERLGPAAYDAGEQATRADSDREVREAADRQVHDGLFGARTVE